MTRVLPGRRAGVAASLALLGIAATVALAGPAAAIPVEGDPDPGQCVRLVHRHTVWPAEVGLTGYVGLPYVAVLVPRAEC
jgi:hypothetical protein